MAVGSLIGFRDPDTLAQLTSPAKLVTRILGAVHLPEVGDVNMIAIILNSNRDLSIGGFIKSLSKAHSLHS